MKIIYIDKDKLDLIRHYLIDNVFRQADVMFDETCVEYDLPEIICGLYEYLHLLVTGESYDYMFHWANKVGAWVETDYFDNLIEEKTNND